MFTKNSLSITTSRFTLIYKVVLYILLILFLFSVIGYGVLYPTLGNIANQVKDLKLGDSIKEYFVSVAKGVVYSDNDGATIDQNDRYETMMSKIEAVYQIFTDNAKRLNVGIFLFIILAYIFAIVYTLLYLPTTTVLYHYMSSGCKLGYLTCYLTEFKKSLLYSFISATIQSIYLILIVFISFMLYKIFVLASAVLALAMVYTFVGMALSMRRALFYGWLPSIVVDKMGIFQAMKNSFVLNKRHFWRTSLIYFSLYLIFTLLLVVATIATFGVATIVILGFNLVFFCALDMVLYYHNAGHKYYKDEQTVVDPSRKYGNAVLENPLKVEE